MVDSRLINKRLVKCLMDIKGIDLITITKDKVLIEVSPKFTPEDGMRLVRKVGHTRYKPVSKDGKNYLVLERY